MLDIVLVGTGGMMPMPKRFLSSMLLRINGKLILVDCGEGTQVSLKIIGWGFKAIDAIVFTHFHADHISGLTGMLLTIGNSGREEALKLIGPKGLKVVVDGLRVIAPELPFDIEYIELDDWGGSVDIGEVTINYIPVEHRITCFAYRFDVKRKGKFDVKKAEGFKLPKIFWSKLQKGETVEYEGNVFAPDMVMGEYRRGISLSYCTDSRPVDWLPEFINGSDIFVCEGMYGENEKLEKAIEHRHMIFSEAATLAKKGNVKKLWLTHFSPSMSEPDEFIQNATDIFPNTEVGFDGKFDTLRFED